MTSCTYMVFIHNHENTIINLVESLKNLSGNFRKEFIFVDDGSTDDSLSVLKGVTSQMQKVTILSQENSGYAISLNKAANLATGEYIHFVEGDEVLHPDSTDMLIKTSLQLDAEAVIGRTTSADKDFLKSPIADNHTLIERPIKKILKKKLPFISQLGGSGSLIASRLLKQAGMADERIYTQNTSLSLRCAKYSSFGYIDSNISSISKRKIDRRFVAYNNIRSIHNFAKENPDIFKGITIDLVSALAVNVLSIKDKIKYRFKAWISKYFNTPSLHNALDLYKKELDKLF